MKSTTLYARYAVLAMAAVATLGSLYFSEILHYQPCVLCWYERILTYPLVVIMLVGILRKDRNLYQYVLPFGVIGWFVSLYHSLLQWKILPEYVAPCNAGVSCVTAQIDLLGFITIPFMAFVAFNIIIGAMIIEWRSTRES